MKAKTRRRLLAVLGAALAVLALSWGAFVYHALSEIAIEALPLQFNLKPGSGLRSAAQQMSQAGALRHPELFIVLARLLGETGNIKAGNYEIDGPLTPYRLLRKVTQGEVTQVAIKFVEGWTFRQMRKALDEHPAVKHDTRELGESEILRRLAIDAVSVEGLFFPSTYYFASGSSDLRILRRAYRVMQFHLAAQWEKRAFDLPLASPYEALILASIVEKETGSPQDRSLVAAVFINRLRKGMLLQADPTVIYGMGEDFDGNLRKKDLVTDTPYNTYLRAGLPPTPISLPGLASLAAALNPPDSDVLYFVSRGDGTSQFSRTHSEHDRAVTKYQRSGKR